MQSDKIVAYNFVAGRRTFIGKKVESSYPGVVLEGIIVIDQVPNKARDGIDWQISALEMASRESRMYIDPTVLPGFVLENLDHEIVEMYASKVVTAYSKLALT